MITESHDSYDGQEHNCETGESYRGTVVWPFSRSTAKTGLFQWIID